MYRGIDPAHCTTQASAERPKGLEKLCTARSTGQIECSIQGCSTHWELMADKLVFKKQPKHRVGFPVSSSDALTAWPAACLSRTAASHRLHQPGTVVGRRLGLVLQIRGVGDAEEKGGQSAAHELEDPVRQDHDDGVLEGSCSGADAEGHGRVEGAARDGAPGVAADGDASADAEAELVAGVGRGGDRHGQDDEGEQEGEEHLHDAHGTQAEAGSRPEREGLARIDEGVRHRGELSSGQLCHNITRSAPERHIGRAP
mmetsp:Transcript_53886/g.175288  ORF Transcript_53886/g.175288 Transcript_53886/m.175288 type:complete len:257 (+) Transcript_53886:350-1120(+)